MSECECSSAHIVHGHISKEVYRMGPSLIPKIKKKKKKKKKKTRNSAADGKVSWLWNGVTRQSARGFVQLATRTSRSILSYFVVWREARATSIPRRLSVPLES